MSTPPPGGDNEPQPPGEGSPQAESPPAGRPSWAWEPDLSPEGTPFEAEQAPPGPPPSPESGQEMLRRLYERGLISEEEYVQRSGSAPSPAPEAQPGGGPSPSPASGPAVPPVVPPPPPPPAGEPGLAWTPPPPPPPAWTPPLPLGGEPYPMRFDIAYPERMSRASTFFRLFLLLPVLLFLWLLSQFVSAALFVGFTTVFWRRKYPDWLFRGLSGAYGFQARAWAYALLLTDRFPSFSPEDSPVVLDYDEPPSGQLSRWRVFFWKFVLLVPHFIVLWLLSFAVFAVTVIAWFGILFTGNYPRGLFQFGVGVQRWWWRTAGYFASFNDRYPPYALSANAGPPGNGTVVASGVIGVLAAGGLTALFITIGVLANRPATQEVDYALLLEGRQQPTWRFPVLGDQEVRLTLVRAHDPGDDLVRVLRPASDERIVVFQWTVVNGSSDSALVAGNVRLKFASEDDEGDEGERSASAEIVTVNNVVAPANVPGEGSATVQAVFVVPEDAVPLELRYRGGFSGGGVKYVFD